MIAYILIGILAISILINSWLIAKLYLQDELDIEDEMGMGSVHWEVEVMAKRIEELIPGVQWNRNAEGYITGIVHLLEVQMQGVGDTEASVD